MMFSNKKAEGEGTLRRIFLAVMIIAIISFLLWKFVLIDFARGTIQECPGAYCRDTCDFVTEYRDGTKTCTGNDKQVCCRPINPSTNPLSAECKGKMEGDLCQGKYKVCTKELKCVELCEYCTSNPTSPKCTFTPDKVLGTKVASFRNGFGCGCTQSECTESAKFTCIKGFCSSTTPGASDYYCCNKGG